MRLWLLALFAIASLSSPALTAEPAYRYCRIGEESVSLLRTVRADGSFAFQSSEGADIVKAGKTELRAYLAWPKSATDAPVLWIAHGLWEGRNYTYIPDDAELGLVGADKVEDRSLATVIPKGDFVLFGLDPRRLLNRFAGLQQLTLRIHARGTKGTIIRSAIDLDALRGALAGTAALATRETPSASCGAVPTDLTEERDVARYTDCRADFRDATGGYWATADRVTWQYRFSPGLWLDADTVAGRWPSDEEFATRMHQPFGPASPFGLRFVSDDPSLGQTVTIVTGGKSTVMRSNYYDPVVWADLTRADTPIVIELRDAKGAVKERDTIPANWFAAAEKNLTTTYDRVLAKQRDPMRYCAPPQDIVIT